MSGRWLGKCHRGNRKKNRKGGRLYEHRLWVVYNHSKKCGNLGKNSEESACQVSTLSNELKLFGGNPLKEEGKGKKRSHERNREG